ncbi:MAG: oligosaccharide flippase family protein [Candidatus Coatesbacteria bacterium]|nr:oligosaccharide flippase family protein [Candidatus Coatesbacteria bacterium]
MAIDSPFEKLRSNFAYSLLGRITDTCGSLIVFWLLSRYFQLETYGEYGWISTIIFTLNPLLNFETSKIITREIAKDRNLLQRYIKAGLHIQILLSVSFVFLTFFSGLIFLKGMNKLHMPFLFAVLNEIIFQFGFVYIAAYYGIENLKMDFISSVIHRLVGILGIFIGIFLDQGLTFFYIALTIGSAFKLVSLRIGFRKQLAKDFTENINPLMKDILRVCYLLAIANFVAASLVRVDAYIIKYIKGLESLALFHAPHQLILQAQIIPSILIAPIFPIIVKVFKEDLEKGKEIYHNFSRLSFTIANIASFFFFGFSDIILLLLGGEKFAKATSTLRLLAISLLPLFLILLNTIALITIGKQKQILAASISSFVINLSLGLLLVPLLDTRGAAIATIIAYSFQATLLMIFVYRHLFKVNVMKIISFIPVIWIPFIYLYLNASSIKYSSIFFYVYPFFASLLLLLSKSHRESLKLLVRK